MGIRPNRAILDTSHKMTFCDTAQSVHKQVRLPRSWPAAEAAAPCGDFRLRMKCGLDLLTESLSHFDP